MQSIRSKIIIWLLKNRHLLTFQLKADVVDSSFSVEKFRADIEKATARIKMPKGVQTENKIINGINAQWILPDQAIEGKVLLYIHGGGFISGSCNTHRMHVAKFALGTRLKSIVFDYRLAPEHPYPAALDDCLSIYQWLLKNGYRAQDIIVGGESAGATLALSLLLWLKEKNIQLPEASFVISPLTDLRCLAKSFTYNARNDIAPMGSWDIWAQYYIADNDPSLPPLSPQMGDFHGLPPMHICVGSHEVHFDDCCQLAEKTEAQGVNVTFKKWDRMVHAFPILSPLFPEATFAIEDIFDFVKAHMRGSKVSSC